MVIRVESRVFPVHQSDSSGGAGGHGGSQRRKPRPSPRCQAARRLVTVTLPLTRQAEFELDEGLRVVVHGAPAQRDTPLTRRQSPLSRTADSLTRQPPNFDQWTRDSRVCSSSSSSPRAIGRAAGVGPALGDVVWIRRIV